MHESKINAWLQILASMGVLIGLMLVAYEIRESNRVATSESVRGIEDCFNLVSVAELETDIIEIYVASIEEPGELTVIEKIKLNTYLNTVSGCFQRWLNMHQLGVARYDGLDTLRDTVDIYFSSAFGRAWFAENKTWMYPNMAEVIESELATIPVRTKAPEIASSMSEQ